MPLSIPPPGSQGIPHDFLAELARDARKPTTGVGVFNSPFARCILGPPPTDSEPEVGPFQLTEDLTPGGSAEAYPIIWNGTAYVVDTAHGTALVYDLLGCFRSPTGAWGFAWQGQESDQNQIIWVQQQAKLCLCQLTAAQTGSDTSFTVDTLTAMDGGIVPTGTITAYNVSASAGADDAVACIEWNENTDHWEVQWIVNTSQSVMTNHQVDTANMKLQMKTRTLWGNWAGDESGWTDEHTGDDCTA